jgi:intracellular sulfur oxidation DsrE/DsrF family protein
VSNSRRSFLARNVAVVAVAQVASPTSSIAATPANAYGFDRAAFDRLIRAPFKHRQVFATGRVADGAVFVYMNNSLNAFRDGYGEGPGTLHAVAVMYGLGVALSLDDDAWKTMRIAQVLRDAGDRVSSPANDINPFVHGPIGRTIGELAERHASFLVCNNALVEFAGRLGQTAAALYPHVLPKMMIVPAGVAAINTLQEERFTLFQASM